jgi:hypothetical protein
MLGFVYLGREVIIVDENDVVVKAFAPENNGDYKEGDKPKIKFFKDNYQDFIKYLSKDDGELVRKLWYKEKIIEYMIENFPEYVV